MLGHPRGRRQAPCHRKPQRYIRLGPSPCPEDGVFRPQGPKRAAASPASGRAEPGERCSRPSTCCSVCSEMKREGGPGQTRTPRRAVGQGHTKVGRRGLGVPPPTWAQEEEGGAWLGAGRTARNTLDWRPSRHHGPQVRLDTNSRGEHEATACDRMRG